MSTDAGVPRWRRIAAWGPIVAIETTGIHEKMDANRWISHVRLLRQTTGQYVHLDTG